MTKTSQFTFSEMNGLVYKAQPRFLAQNLSKKVRLIHESLKYLPVVSQITVAVIGEKVSYIHIML